MKQNSLQYQQEILHKALEISKRFSAWFEANSHGFVENEDFIGVYLKVQGNQYGGEQCLQDYKMSVRYGKTHLLNVKERKREEDQTIFY